MEGTPAGLNDRQQQHAHPGTLPGRSVDRRLVRSLQQVRWSCVFRADCGLRHDADAWLGIAARSDENENWSSAFFAYSITAERCLKCRQGNVADRSAWRKHNGQDCEH